MRRHGQIVVDAYLARIGHPLRWLVAEKLRILEVDLGVQTK
jgi:hypothetical protein